MKFAGIAWPVSGLSSRGFGALKCWSRGILFQSCHSGLIWRLARRSLVARPRLVSPRRLP
jgi:hypothetical protein